MPRRKASRTRAPSYAGFRPSSESASRAKQANRARNTQPEVHLQRALKKLGFRFQTHREDLPGCPDIVFPRDRVVVFCDGDFWHGRHWTKLKRALKRRANPRYWVAKIQANRLRDARTRRALRQKGWSVVRLWETDIRRNPSLAATSLKTRLTKLHSRRPERSGRAARKRPPASSRTRGSTGAT